MTTIYVDNAATTKTSRTAIEAMLPYMDKIYGNPSSLNSVGQAAADALRKAREEAAEVLGCEPNEITFTSGGSEADNQALVSAAAIGARKGKKHIISTAFEHHAILHTLKKLEKEGFEVTLLDVHENGMVSAQQVAEDLKATGHDVTLKLFDGGRHEILNETNRDEVEDYIAAWADAALENGAKKAE